MARSLRCQLRRNTSSHDSEVRKTVEVLQVQHLDKVIGVARAQLSDEAVEVPEITQRQRLRLLKRLGKQSRSAAQEAAQTQAALNKKRTLQ